MSDKGYIYANELGIDYPLPPKKNCGSCKNSKVTNPGAHIPGCGCGLLPYIAKKKGISKINPQVNNVWGTCKFHNISLKAIKELETLLFNDAK